MSHQTNEKTLASCLGFLFHLKPLISTVCHSELSPVTISLVSLALRGTGTRRGRERDATVTLSSFSCDRGFDSSC